MLSLLKERFWCTHGNSWVWVWGIEVLTAIWNWFEAIICICSCSVQILFKSFGGHAREAKFVQALYSLFITETTKSAFMNYSSSVSVHIEIVFLTVKLQSIFGRSTWDMTPFYSEQCMEFWQNWIEPRARALLAVEGPHWLDFGQILTRWPQLDPLK